MEKEKYQNYINNFRRRLVKFLKPGIGLSCNIYPSKDGGAILEFNIGINNINDDNYEEVSDSLGKALKNIKQNAFGGNLDGFHFGGTNTILEENRIIYIKESNQNEWNDASAEKDVNNLINSSNRTK